MLSFLLWDWLYGHIYFVFMYKYYTSKFKKIRQLAIQSHQLELSWENKYFPPHSCKITETLGSYQNNIRKLLGE